jgi:hypothetical protein
MRLEIADSRQSPVLAFFLQSKRNAVEALRGPEPKTSGSSAVTLLNPLVGQRSREGRGGLWKRLH